MPDVWFEKRYFLNKIGFHSSAIILGYIRTTDSQTWIDSDLVISDCGEQVHLSIDCHSPAARENTVYKLRTIASVCAEMADWIEQNGKTLDNRVKRARIENNERGRGGSRNFYEYY